MKYYLVAGEASGDLHSSNLMKELKIADSSAIFRFFGGDLMQTVGGHLVKHYREMAFMGFVKVLLNIKTIKRNLKLCKKDLLKFNPDVLILIDYPGFNLRIAEFAKQNNIKVFYYISPKFWAWKEYRVRKVKLFVDEMFTILPFETEFYRQHEINVNYVGNPLLDEIEDFHKKKNTGKSFIAENNLNEKPIVALISGSRVQEIKKILPVMLNVSQNFPQYQFVIAGVNFVDINLYKQLLKNSEIKIVFNQTYNLLQNSFAALVTSGTATLETALFDVPQTVLYKTEGGLLADIVVRKFVLKTKWVSLPNIILRKEAIRELLQKDMTIKKVSKELNELLTNDNYRNEILKDYNGLKEIIGEAGCSKRAAEKMVKILNQKLETLNSKL